MVLPNGKYIESERGVIYENAPIDISYAVYDVPYYELESSGVYFAKNKLNVSSFFTKIVLNFISNKIKEEIGFDIFETKTEEACKYIRIPAIFIASYNDELVPFEDFDKIFYNYGSSYKKMIITNKPHADPREPQIIAEAVKCMLNGLLDTKYTIDDSIKIMMKSHNEKNAKRLGKMKKQFRLDSRPISASGKAKIDQDITAAIKKAETLAAGTTVRTTGSSGGATSSVNNSLHLLNQYAKKLSTQFSIIDESKAKYQALADDLE
jgi:hypothetical protein